MDELLISNDLSRTKQPLIDYRRRVFITFRSIYFAMADVFTTCIVTVYQLARQVPPRGSVCLVTCTVAKATCVTLVLTVEPSVPPWYLLSSSLRWRRREVVPDVSLGLCSTYVELFVEQQRILISIESYHLKIVQVNLGVSL